MVDYRELLRAMIRIRRVEEVLAETYRAEQEMRTPVHFSIGQEAVAVGVCAGLRQPDLVYSGHRCHAHYLARGGDLTAMVAELYGRENGCTRGRGGSVHLVDEAAGFAASSAILGEMIPVATGAAWASALRGEPGVAVTFFGDGAAEEGVFHESLNFAALHRLPVLYVCENNGYSMSSPLSARQPAGTRILEWARSHGVPGAEADGNDVTAVAAAAEQALRWCRDGNGPYYLEFATYRWREHVGPGVDGRDKSEVDSWRARCPIRHLTGVLRVGDPGIDAAVARWQEESTAEVAEAIAVAKASAFPDVAGLLDGTYAR